VCNKLQAHKSWENNLNKAYSFSKFSSAIGRNISLHFHQVGVSNGQAYFPNVKENHLFVRICSTIIAH